MKQLFRVLSLAGLLGILALNLMSCQASDLSQLQNANGNFFSDYSRYAYADREATAKTDNEIARPAKEPAATRPAKEPAATRPAKEQGSVKTEEITETVIAARPIRKNEEN